jgi:transposase
MKQNIIDACLAKEMKWKEGAKLLSMHPKSLSRLKKRYLIAGLDALSGKKPGPKRGSPANRTPEFLENYVVQIARDNPSLGPIDLAELFEEGTGRKIDQSTVWRILQRRGVRYTEKYVRWKKDPKLYCLDEPGEELQFDGCFPWGRQRKIVGFDVIDDCSRWGYGKCYEGTETVELALKFITELLDKAPFRIQRIRVDNRYAKRFKEYCEKELGIEVIVNDAYSPQQNGKVERFHGTVKRDFFWKYCKFEDSLEDINYKYSLWLEHYNYHRKHSGYGMNRLTPVQKMATTWFYSLNNLNLQKVTGTLQQHKTCNPQRKTL